MSSSQQSGPPEFVRAMGAVARELLGDPTSKTPKELRFGSRGSLSVRLDTGTWHDHEANCGGGVLDLVQLQRHTDKNGALEWLRQRGHLAPGSPSNGHRNGSANGQRHEVATYDYTDAAGSLVFQVVRFEPKDFRQRAPNGNGGWRWKMDGVQRVIYRLPEVAAAISAGRTVYIAEGEKAVDELTRIGITGTCSPGGANKWKPEYSKFLAGADVVILPDADDAGQKHAASVARALQGIARQVKVLTLPGLPFKGDVADWIAAGGTAAELEELARAKAPIATDHSPSEALPASAEASALDGFDLTEDGIALAFTEKHREQLRYDHTRAAWFRWTGKAWCQDETKLAFSWSRRICREQSRRPGIDARRLATLAKAATAAAVERFAQSDQELATTSASWDRDPMLLGTPDGTIDLRTGELRAAAPEDYITRLTAVAPAKTPECPMWLAFMDQVTGHDPALIRFLRQWCGYCLTGDIREHALLFAHGPGGNGKGVFLNTVSRIMGDYARNAAMETFTASAGDKHPTDLAMLRGARLVTASETEEGRAWAEARIKAMTGGDPITARFMRQDFFEYVPQFKLTMIGNHKPVLRNVDDAVRRRFNMVPFVFKPAKPDMQLQEKLRAEWPAILRWMIEGCLDWQMHGLVRPQVVAEATAEYFSEQDTVMQWVEERCERTPTQSDTVAALFKSWSDYALANGEKPGTSKWFSQTLLRLGCEPVKSTPGNRGQRGFKGINVRATAEKARHEPKESWPFDAPDQ